MRSNSTTPRMCFFCSREIVGRYERHHIRPRRTFRKGDNHRKDNIAPCHPRCHQTWHRRFDHPRMKWGEYKRAFEPLKFGAGIFAD